jgi:hypothetical protein
VAVNPASGLPAGLPVTIVFELIFAHFCQAVSFATQTKNTPIYFFQCI